MGNDISRNSDDIAVHELTSSTVKYLNNYHVLPKYPSDRTTADRLISTIATKALKSVNTDFRISLNNKSKRKFQSTPSHTDDNNGHIEKRRSPRKVTSSGISMSPDVFQSTNTKNKNPSIVQSSISYRVMLPNDLLRLEEGCNVVLVVDKESYGFRKSIFGYLDDITLSIHKREQEGSSKYEFPMIVKAFSIRPRILNGSVSQKDLTLRYNQGDGITLVSEEYPGLLYNVRFKDILRGKIQLYEKIIPFFKHPDFFAAAGRSRDPRVYGPIYQSFLNMVHGDTEQTLRVLVAYYRQKTESLANEALQLNRDFTVPVVQKSEYDTTVQYVKTELNWSKTTKFTDFVDSIYYQAIVSNFETWHDPCSPLIPDSVVESLILEFESSYPLAALFFSTMSNNNTTTRGFNSVKNNKNKRHLAFVQFLSMARLRNPKKLVWWAMVEALALMGRGIPKAATANIVMNRQAMSYGAVAAKLNEFAPSVKMLNRRLLQNECTLDTAFDNYQEFNSRKYQRDGASSDSMHATCRLAKRSFPVVPTVGSVVLCDTNEYLVMAILYQHTYASLLRVRSIKYGSTHPLPWPSVGWSIDILHNADPASSQIDYRSCYVPRSLHMQRVVYKTTNHMIFSDLKELNQAYVKPSNVIPCLTSDYIRILNRSRTVTAMHKALVSTVTSNVKESSNVKTTTTNTKQANNITKGGHIKMIDIMNAESMKYCDQNNIDVIQSMFNEQKDTFMRARKFQETYVGTWNRASSEVSMLLYLELSKFDEISNDGSVQVLIELLHDYGLINKDPEKIGHYIPVDRIDSRRMRIYGDCLSMEKIRQVQTRVYSAITHPGKAEFVSVILQALTQCQQGVGDLHVAMHMLVLIYKIYYPGMMQVIQAVLRWKRIQLNPLHRYQSSRDLAEMTYSVLERMRVRHWCKLIKRHKNDVLRHRCISSITESDKDSDEVYSLDELTSAFDHDTMILMLASDYEIFCSELMNSNDQVVLTIANFMKLMSDFTGFISGTRCGDSIGMEHILNEWLPIWKAGGKSNYTNLTMTNIEILYSEMSPTDLEGMRINRCVRRTKGHNMMAMDECCEILNDYLKKMISSANLSSLVNKSLFVSLMRRCKNVYTAQRQETDESKGKRITPSRKRDNDTIAKLFATVLPFTSLNRIVDENWLWGSYNSCKTPVRTNNNNCLTSHQQKVADVFNIISNSSPADVPTESSDGNTETVATVKNNAEYACGKLGQDEVFTEDQSGDLISQDDNINLTPASIDTVTRPEELDDDEDPDAALKALSNMKRYKINHMCYENTVVIGWSKLGNGLEEERRWLKMLQQQERLQIKEAVDYYINRQKRRREKLNTILDVNVITMPWEQQLRRAMKDKIGRREFITKYSVNTTM